MVYRPHDICSAAFYGDIQRLRLLATQDVPGGVIDNEEEPLEDAEEEAIDADPEMVNLLAQYELGAASDDDERPGNDTTQMEDDVDDVELQQNDIALFRRIIRRQLRETALARNINTPGLLQVGPNPVECIPHGIFFSIREHYNVETCVKIYSGNPSQEGEAQSSLDELLPLRVSWKPSKRSPLKASPLHWAVLSRAHEAIRLLIELGADPQQVIRHELGSGQPASLELVSLLSGSRDGGEKARVVKGLTPEDLAVANNSLLTLKTLREAVTIRKKLLEKRNEEKQSIECRLEQRKARREKERLSREQRRMQEEELEESAYSRSDGSDKQEHDYGT